MSLGATMSTPASACVSACFDQHLHRLVVQDVAGVVEQAVLAVAGEGIQRHVGHHAQLREVLPGPHHARHQAVRVQGFAPSGVFSAGSMTGNSAITGMPSATQCFGHRQQQVQAQALHARHGGDLRRGWPSSTNTG